MTKSKSKPNSNFRTLFIIGSIFGVVILFTYFMSYFSSSVVENVFKVLNFGIFFGLVCWVFKAKQIPQAKEKIAQKQAELHAKADENKTLFNLQKQIDLEIKNQELFAQKLYDQVKIWSVSFKQQQKELQSEQTELTKKAVKRAQQQAENKMSRAVRELVFERALQSAQKKLEQQFASHQEGKRFNAVIFEFMRKEVS